MREAVVVLLPDVRSQQVIQRRDGPPPGDLARAFEPLGMLVEHGIHDVDECLVAGEKSVTAGQQIALEPSLAQMLAQG